MGVKQNKTNIDQFRHVSLCKTWNSYPESVHDFSET